MEKNKVKFGLKNVHYAMLSETTDPITNKTVYSYSAPKAWPGAVNLSMDAQGGLSPFYADDRRYYVTYSHTGYEGDLETALVPDSVYQDVFGDTIDENGVLIENTVDQPNPFALLFEFDGDKNATRHVLYNCTMTRPSVSGATKEDTATPQTESSTISAMPREDNLLHAKTTATTDTSAYNGFYNAVYEPDTEPSALISGLTIGINQLIPNFDPNVTEYTVATANASDVVTVAKPSTINVAITVGEGDAPTPVTNGSAASWTEGENILKIVATGADLASTTYTVTVTYTE